MALAAASRGAGSAPSRAATAAGISSISRRMWVIEADGPGTPVVSAGSAGAEEGRQVAAIGLQQSVEEQFGIGVGPHQRVGGQGAEGLAAITTERGLAGEMLVAHHPQDKIAELVGHRLL